MLRLSHLFESNSRRECADPNMELSQYSTLSKPVPESPQSASSSNPASPVTSLFSTRTHNRFPSSVSSLASSPGGGGSTEAFSSGSAMKTQLTEVKEEPFEPEKGYVEEDSYFRMSFYACHSYFFKSKRLNASLTLISIAHFNDFHAAATADNAHISLESHDYDFSDEIVEIASSTTKKRSDRHFQGISRISTRFSSLSSKWKQKSTPISDTALALEKYDESLRSRANSTTSAVVSPAMSSLSARQSLCAPPSARTTFEERVNEVGILPLDVDKANTHEYEGCERHVRTPLLPPVMKDLPHLDNEATINSPLQSPSVANDGLDSLSGRTSTGAQTTPETLPSSFASAHPSLSSISRQIALARTHAPESAPIIMSDSNDVWSSKLGHANFTIQPEPYLPEVSSLETFEEHRTNWELARCNYAKHLVRTGEHYGITSSIYKLTQEKWESVNKQWKRNHDHLIAHLQDSCGNHLSLDPSDVTHPDEDIKIPGLHDKGKFPDLGDEDIVGPMLVEQRPASEDRPISKRGFLKFILALFTFRQVK